MAMASSSSCQFQFSSVAILFPSTHLCSHAFVLPSSCQNNINSILTFKLVDSLPISHSLKRTGSCSVSEFDAAARLHSASSYSMLLLLQESPRTKRHSTLRKVTRIAVASIKETEKEAESSSTNGETSVTWQTSSESKKESAAKATPSGLSKEFSNVVKKTASTFAPRASTARKNPAVPGSTLYTVFEVQGYLSMALGGLLSFNLIFPSNEPDIWRLMGMWSVWMFTIPSLRARDCSSKEKDALNFLFLAIPLINITIPCLWKSFGVVWSTDILVFFAIYAWKVCPTGTEHAIR
ncbi:hypothetical protein O6H91_09G052500 [Diphasiastrum complanatum]|uniref:Uncharacterized protein n=1 Tax=Diphasiastrum complanatum TaxID=34168 RepID=A0ACC2CP37_DIPCM|nr:hypothetical protein O6H91_09G052500 [Diphasiastrum complanatum]